jgi:kynurenine formamidase
MNSKEEGLEFYDLSHGIVGFENVGGEIDEVTGKRVTLAAFPWR